MSALRSPDPARIELAACADDPGYFLDRYASIYDATLADWVPFRLWRAQIETLDAIRDDRLLVILKARQLGLTWLVLGYALWEVLFRPKATVLLFSRRDDDAVDLLRTRLRGMYDRLPPWLKVRHFVTDNDHEWELSNGSRVMAFPTTAGDSYTATLAFVDEADLVPDLDRLMRAVKPTIDGGGRMVLLSRADKSKPESTFKNIYRAARGGESDWRPIFLSWDSRPDRDAAWYEAQRRDVLARTGALDDLHEQYPATDLEALAPRSLDKRISAEWLRQCYVEKAPLAALPHDAPAIPGLSVFALPVPGQKYAIGGDPAEGNPKSDDSAGCVLDATTGDQVAQLRGKIEPSAFASALHRMAQWYNNAAILVERNNHGHAVLLWLRDHARDVPKLHGHHSSLILGHDKRPGWLSSQLGKTQLYDNCADAVRNREVTIRSFAAFTQLASIEAATLRAPEGQHDDVADAFALACAARLSLGARPVIVHVLDFADMAREALLEERGLPPDPRNPDGTPMIVERTKEEIEAELKRVMEEDAKNLWRRLAGEPDDEQIVDGWAGWR